MSSQTHAIEVHQLSKSYGSKLVIDNLSFVVEPGVVTGFLGPNGSGKSTTMRLIVGLDHASHGTARIGGVAYAHLRRPLSVVGTLLDSEAVHPGRSARNHLIYLARTQSISTTRVEAVLDMVGLVDVQHERTGSFSLGMRKRLGIAAAMLGDPSVYIFDEPINGLDPDGILWMRTLMKQFAADGKTVLVSSHLMGEMALTAHNLVVIDHGKLIAECTTEDLISRTGRATVLVESNDAAGLAAAIDQAGGTAGLPDHDSLTVRDMSARLIGDIADTHRIALRKLIPREASLEEAFLHLTHDVSTTDHHRDARTDRKALV